MFYLGGQIWRLSNCAFLPGLPIVNIGWHDVDEKLNLTEYCLICQFILPEIRTGSFSKEFRCSDARKKYLEQVHFLLKNLPVSSLKIRKNAIISQEASKDHKEATSL